MLLSAVRPEDRLTRRDMHRGGRKADVLHRHRHFRFRFLGERRTDGDEQTDDTERGPQDAQAQPVGTRHPWHSTVFRSPTAKAPARFTIRALWRSRTISWTYLRHSPWSRAAAVGSDPVGG